MSSPETEINDGLKVNILQEAQTLLFSSQDRGGQFLRPCDSNVLPTLVRSLSNLLAEYDVDQRGILIDDTPLDQIQRSHRHDPEADTVESALVRGFWSGVSEELDWIGITKDKWSRQTPDTLALEGIAAAWGIPTSRQFICLNPNMFVGCKVERNIFGRYKFLHGEVDGIIHIIEQIDEPPTASFLRGYEHTLPNFKELEQAIKTGYRKGVSLAFLHYVAIGKGRVQTSIFEMLV